MKKFIPIIILSVFTSIHLSAFKKASTYLDRTFFEKGSIGNYTIIMALKIKPLQNKVSGYYLYLQSGKKLPLKGTIYNNVIEMTEENENGTNTGHFEGTMGHNGSIKGKWYSAHNKQLNFELSLPEKSSERIEESYFMSGKLSQYPISMVLTLNDQNDSVTGYYKYDRIGKKIKLKGSCYKNGKLQLKEYVNNLPTGSFDGILSDGYIAKGTWHSVQGNKSFVFLLKTANDNAMVVIHEISKIQITPSDYDTTQFIREAFVINLINTKKQIVYSDEQNKTPYMLVKDYQNWIASSSEDFPPDEVNDDISPYGNPIRKQAYCTIETFDNHILSYKKHFYTYGMSEETDDYNERSETKGCVLSLTSMQKLKPEDLVYNVSDQKLCTIQQKLLLAQVTSSDSTKIFDQRKKEGFADFLSDSQWWITDQGIEANFSEIPHGEDRKEGYTIFFSKKDLLPFVKSQYTYLFR